MKRRNVMFVAVVWLVSLVGVGLWAQSDLKRVPTLVEGAPVGPVISGENIGFQPVAGEHAPGKVVGKWMVKIDGKWVEAQPSIGIVR